MPLGVALRQPHAAAGSDDGRGVQPVDEDGLERHGSWKKEGETKPPASTKQRLTSSYKPDLEERLHPKSSGPVNCS
ncbi:hypothetical protein UFOVP1244_88 [uncultured Caudovirales phage]|uniref:Uncharacterized protein n=1 Tax=uncultured Caudovirales phage TaxID=2100421 RepID=A0A6J5RKM8_9CAUD|nr:hypothetical protein UFOVP1244_88 [uncultured Caudovirales phage]